MDQRIPPVLHPLILDYVQQFNLKSSGLVSAFYLVGSIALDSFQPEHSDIDFVATLCRKATLEDFESIREIHKGLEVQYPQWKMEGMYFQVGDLGCLDDEVEPYLNYHDGTLQWSDRFGLGAITWWILKHHGIAILGPDLQALTYTVDMDYLLKEQIENLNSYWASWVKRPIRIAALFSDWGIQWTVLGVLRQFYTLREKDITSKTKAGEYALVCLPEHWHPIIREAIAMRESPKKSCYHSRAKRAIDAFGFIRFIIRTCNESS